MSEILSISTEEAQMLCRKVLLTTGLTKSAAEKITNILLQNEFDGYPSHGIMRVYDYVMDIRDGKVYPHSTINIQKENDYFTTITADKNLGIYVLSTLEDLLKNDTFGNIHFVAIKNSHHLGRLATIARIFTSRGYIVQGFSNYNGWGQKVAVPNGDTPRLATNPIVYALPLENGNDFIFDMTTSVTSEGSIRQSDIKGNMLQEGLLVDAKGQNVEDPALFYEEPMRAFLSPLGGKIAGHKGFGLAFIAEIYASLSEGAGHIAAPARNPGNSAFFQIVRPDVLHINPKKLNSHVMLLKNYLAQNSSVRIPGGSPSSWEDALEITDTVWKKVKTLL